MSVPIPLTMVVRILDQYSNDARWSPSRWHSGLLS